MLYIYMQKWKAMGKIMVWYNIISRAYLIYKFGQILRTWIICGWQIFLNNLFWNLDKLIVCKL
jgi:hypothetical protein